MNQSDISGNVIASRSIQYRDGANESPQYHNEDILKKYQKKLRIGDLKEEAKL